MDLDQRILQAVRDEPNISTTALCKRVNYKSNKGKEQFLRTVERVASLHPELKFSHGGHWNIVDLSNCAGSRTREWAPLRPIKPTIVLRGAYMRNFE